MPVGTVQPVGLPWEAAADAAGALRARAAPVVEEWSVSRGNIAYAATSCTRRLVAVLTVPAETSVPVMAVMPTSILRMPSV